jgi:hypothetical protein
MDTPRKQTRGKQESGTESQIISQEVYSKVDQSKIHPDYLRVLA